MILNGASDQDTFKFYNEEKTKGNLGTINIKGCFIVGDDALESNESDYNYVSTLKDAVEKGVLSGNVAEEVNGATIIPNKKSEADIKISAKTYHEWSELLASYRGNLKVGSNFRCKIKRKNRMERN